MTKTRNRTSLQMLLAVVFASSIASPAAISQAAPGAAPAPAEASQPGASSAAISAEAWRMRESTFFQRNWGVEIVGVRMVSSGHMLEFRYHVLDSKKAAPINDKKANPLLVDEK